MNKKFPLVVEEHPSDYEGYDFITLIRYSDVSYLNIVDNVTKKYIYGYVIDLCGPTGFNEELLIQTAYEWYHSNGDRYPISIEFSKRGMMEQAETILRAFPLDYVTRVIGPLPHFDMGGPRKVRKRKKKNVPKGMEVTIKRIKEDT
jgi:hypothetical protein